jgi:hypothetical protein
MPLDERRERHAALLHVIIENDVNKWQKDFLDANSARPRIFDGVAEAKLIALTLTPAPEGFARWSLRLLEEKVVELHIVVGERHEPEDISPSSLPVRWSVGGVSAWLSDRIGRRLNFILYEVGSIAIVIAYTLLPMGDTLMLVLGFPLGFFSQGVFLRHGTVPDRTVPDPHAWLGPRVQP